jgi:Family of unknown function (DUF6492)
VESLGLLLKSYEGDREIAGRLVASIRRYNRDDLPLWIVVPECDLESFRPLEDERTTVLSEELFREHLVDEPVAGIRPGYINQQIVKLAFWELSLVDNYFVLDSDLEFVRPFGRSDLMHDDETPFTVLVEDNELRVEPRYYHQYWVGREASLRAAMEVIGLDDTRLLTCHNHQVFSARVLRSLKQELLEPRGWSYRDLMEIAPYEFAWYNFWLQQSKVIPIHIREPLVKMFHHEGQHLEYAMRGITTEDIARGYIGVVVNSNFARSWGQIGAQESPAETLARYVDWRTLTEAVRLKAAGAVRRRAPHRGRSNPPG